MQNTPTEPQQRILDFIRKYMLREGRPPTNREIGHAVGIRSTGHVDHHLTALEHKGHITRVRGKSRGIQLHERVGYGVPIVGTIAAGAPIDHYPDTEHEPLDMDVNTNEETFVLRVKGDSMIDDCIADGDFVLINPDVHPTDGDIVVATHFNAMTEGGAATLKRLYREAGRIRLQPANSAHQPIYVDAAEWDHEWQVQGKVIAVFRQC
jgi:repressor LexA